MIARMTAAQARAAGIDLSTARPAKVRTRRVAKGHYHTRCHTCGDEFNTMAAEDRHLNDTGHRRYAIVLGLSTKGNT